ncbi:MAG: hypothetical protein PHT07_17735 [Paludibacter sp.]|nr:hypothetical protein [Paludibacter sp.]
MKRQIAFWSLIIICVIALKSQTINKNANDSIEKYKFALKILKADFEKPKYNYKYEKIDNKKEFGKIELSKSAMESVFDTLKASSKLHINKTIYGVDLNLTASFPKNFNYSYNDLWRIARITIKDYTLHNRFGHELDIYKSGCTSFPTKPEKTKGEPYNRLYTNFQTRFKDSVAVDPLTQGAVEFEICFVSDYNKIQLTKADILKTFKINNETFKLIDIFENKVVLEQVNDQSICTDIQLLNMDSTDQIPCTKNDPLVYDLKTKSYNEPVSYAAVGSLTLPKEIYRLFKENPAVTVEEYSLMEKEIEKNKEFTKYIVLTSPAPMNSKFIIYSPNYGFIRQFTVKLNLKA